MKTIQIRLKKAVDNSYPLVIGNGIFEKTILEKVGEIKPTKIGLITDSHILPHYESFIRKIFKNYPLTITSFKAGEQSKNIDTIMDLFSVFAGEKFDRKSLFIAFGGGVAGDMAGFLASIYMRGVPIIQVPTSLLAMADSSVGGKTGIDSPEGKNLIGAFNQPKCVIMDMEFLKSLPKNEFTNGMAELIKHGIIKDTRLFGFITDYQQEITSLMPDPLIQLIYSSCKVKGYVVEKDEKESGLRQTLNYGHTIGHAIEHSSQFEIPHGFSIALGFVAEGYISMKKGILSEPDLNKIIAILKQYHLLDFIDKLKSLSIENILDFAMIDKKNIGKSINCILIKNIGKVYNKNGKYSWGINQNEILDSLKYLTSI